LLGGPGMSLVWLCREMWVDSDTLRSDAPVVKARAPEPPCRRRADQGTIACPEPALLPLCVQCDHAGLVSALLVFVIFTAVPPLEGIV
jgi:hypothetical protein